MPQLLHEPYSHMILVHPGKYPDTGTLTDYNFGTIHSTQFSRYHSTVIDPISYGTPGPFLVIDAFQNYNTYHLNLQKINDECYLVAAADSLLDYDFEKRFTIDFWFKITSLSLQPGNTFYYYYFENGANGFYAALTVKDGSNYYVTTYCDDAQTGTKTTQFTVPNTIAWHHYAVIRDSDTTINSYLDGTVGSQAIVLDSTYHFASVNKSICKIKGTANPDVSQEIADLDMSEFAVSSMSLWSGNFTPPVFPYLH